jgi:methyl-accepting chemotaxis protein
MMAIQQAKLSKVVQVGFLVILIVMVTNSMALFLVMRKTADSAFWVTHTYEVKLQFEKLKNEIDDAEAAERGFLYANNEDFLEPYEKALSMIQETQKTILELIKDNPPQVQRMKLVGEVILQKNELMASVILLHKTGKGKKAKDLVSSPKTKKIMDDIQAGVNELTHFEDALLEQRDHEANGIQRFAILFILGGTLTIFATGLFIYLYISRNVINKFILPVNEAIAAISSSTNEIIVTMEQHERAASQQSAAANETFATITQLSVASRQSAEQAATAATMAENARTATAQGGDAIHQAMVAIVSLRDKISAMADQILRLGEQTGQVGSIVTLVKDLSGQINMLALNAAVEAARAGEHGKGFAVVASEVRKLADQSKKSAEQASTLVADIQKATNSSIMMTEEGTRTVAEVTQLAQKVAEQFNSLSGMAGSVNENAQQVMLNAKQQSAAFTQVVAATNILAAGAKETAAGISQTKIGVQKLNDAAEKLKAIA